MPILVRQQHLPHAKATQVFGASIAGLFNPGDCVYVKGDLGAGKTCLIASIIKVRCQTPRVTSPTFNIVNQYDFAAGVINHFDLYRIEQAQQLLDIGIADYFSEDAISFIEWPQNGVGCIVAPTHEIELKITADGRDAQLWTMV